ncbi:MAG: CHAT domain-containing protein, partial [Bacteroidota bacterium]
KGHRPDMVLLSACETAIGDEKGDVTGVADTLLEGGIPAVLAMSASVLDNCASFFAAQLYEQIASGFALPYAFQQSCWALRDFEMKAFGKLLQQAQLAAGQWLIPQLLLSQNVAHLVDENATKSELDFSKNLGVVQGGEALLDLRVRPKNYVFVGRRKEKRAAFHALKAGKSVLLRGQGGVGKTALAEHLAIRLLVRHPRTKVFTHSEKTPAADSLIQQMTTYLTKEHKEFKVVRELAVIEKLQDKFLYLLGEVSQYCEPLFIFDNVESFQAYDDQQQAWVWNINQHEDVLTLLQVLDQYSDFPMLVTSRYPLAEFPEWTLVNMNSAPFGDFFKKCSQMRFAAIAPRLQNEKETALFKKAGKDKINFEEVVRLLYTTLGGNYRALEFFDEAYDKDKEGIFQVLQQLAD